MGERCKTWHAESSFHINSEHPIYKVLDKIPTVWNEGQNYYEARLEMLPRHAPGLALNSCADFRVLNQASCASSDVTSSADGAARPPCASRAGFSVLYSKDNAVSWNSETGLKDLEKFLSEPYRGLYLTCDREVSTNCDVYTAIY